MIFNEWRYFFTSQGKKRRHSLMLWQVFLMQDSRKIVVQYVSIISVMVSAWTKI